jgi:hypothetical protein
MTTQEKVDEIIHEVTALPEEAQAELVDSLLEMRLQHRGIYRLDDDEREALSRSSEDIRLGRFVSNEKINQMYDSYRA